MLDNALTTQLKTYLEMVREPIVLVPSCLLYTSDAADE